MSTGDFKVGILLDANIFQQLVACWRLQNPIILASLLWLSASKVSFCSGNIYIYIYIEYVIVKFHAHTGIVAWGWTV